MQHQGGVGCGPPRDGSAGTSGGCGGGGDRDRISALSDDMCCLILSFLKAWEVVRTSTLSRRWRYLWATTPCLDIRHPCACDARADQERYGEFVMNLLFRWRGLNAPLDTLRLHWRHGGGADTWISYAVRCEATVIELSGKNHHKKPEPEYRSFISESKKPRILKLTHVTLDSRILRGLCSTSASLEELELRNCQIYGYEIQSTLLKRLTMINCMTPSGLLVDAPNLVLLRCIRPYSVVPRIENSKSLVTATIMFDDSCLRHGLRCKWPAEEDEDDDDDGCFTYACAADSDDSESDYDDDSSAAAGAEDSHGINDPDFSSAGAGAEDSHGINDPDFSESGESDTNYDSKYDDSEFSGSDDKKGDDLEEHDGHTVYSSKDANDGPSDYGAGDDRSNGGTIYGGDDILHGLSNVRKMDLLAHRGEFVLRRELKNSCPMFENLKTLSLGEWCIAPDFDALSTILEHSPNLENLILHLDMDYNSRDGINPRGRSFACNNLNMVKITCSKDDTRVHKLANFFRANGVLLDKIFARQSEGRQSLKGEAQDAGRSC